MREEGAGARSQAGLSFGHARQPRPSEPLKYSSAPRREERALDRLSPAPHWRRVALSVYAGEAVPGCVIRLGGMADMSDPKTVLHHYLQQARDALVSKLDGRWCLKIGQLNSQLLAVAERQLPTARDGGPLAASTASGYRRVAHACIRRAVDLEILAAGPWPPRPRGRSQRKVACTKQLDLRRLREPRTMAEAINAIASHQPRIPRSLAFPGRRSGDQQ